MQAFRKVLHVWQRILVQGCHQIEMAIIATRPPQSVFLGTMCKGEAHGDFERQIMPVDSNLLNSVGNLQFFGDWGGGTLQKLGGSYRLILNSMGWCWLHIPGAQNRGEICNKALLLAGTASGIFCKVGRGSNIDWFSLKLKLDTFTSGFWTTCAGMAGGWEVVIAAGS
jgi:hypothetical protein